MPRSFRAFTLLALVGGLLFASTLWVTATTQVLFRVTTASAYARGRPCWSAPKVTSVFARQAFVITGRTADNAWLRVNVPGVSAETWVSATAGQVEGSLDGTPVLAVECSGASATATPAATSGPAATPAPAVTSNGGGPVDYGLKMKFTITERSLYGRDRPDWNAATIASLFQKQSYLAVGRNADGSWLAINYPGIAGLVWVPAGAGSLKGNANLLPDLDGLRPAGGPSATPIPVPTLPAKARILSPYFANVGGGSLKVNIGSKDRPVEFVVPYNIRNIYQRGLRLGNRSQVFTKVGDCESAGNGFLRAFGYSDYQYNLGDYGYLQGVIDLYRSTPPRPGTDNSFTYTGAAAHNGFTVWSVLDPRWADRTVCKQGEMPIECEYRLTRPGLAIIMLGSADLHAMEMPQFKEGLRHIVIYTLNSGTVPVLSTIPGHPARYDQTKAFNWAITLIGQEYGVPVMDLWQALQTMPNRGMVEDGFHMTYATEDELAGQFSQHYLENYGVTIRNLLSLQALEAVWKVLNSK